MKSPVSTTTLYHEMVNDNISFSQKLRLLSIIGDSDFALVAISKLQNFHLYGFGQSQLGI